MSAQSGPATEGHSPDVMWLCRYLYDRSPQPMVAVEGPGHVVSYLNPAFARLVGKAADELIGPPFAEAVPEGEGNGCLALLDRVYRTGAHEILTEQEHRQTPPAFWTYSVWAILGADERPAGVMIQVTDATEIATFRTRSAAMNEALVLSSVRQHELAEAAESLNARLREAHDRLEERVAQRTAELARSNEALTAEIARRERTEADRRNLQRRLTTAHEDERRRIARELHDQMGQHLTALGLGLKVVKDATPDPSEARDRLQELQALTGLMGREVHNLALALRPTALDDLGLQSALANYAEGWSERSGVEVDCQAIGLDGDRLPASVETALYRVVQEALTNVLKHAQARRVSLVLQRFPGHVSVVVEDDGRGFDVETVTAPAGDGGRLGLLGMRERVALVGGTLTVESFPGQGTTVIARIPLPAGGGEGRDR
jgi:PAS domain S-box-containing protein